LAFSASPRVSRIKSPGYAAPPDLAEAILDSMAHDFGLKPEDVKCLPYSNESGPTMGRRIAHHDIHRTYIRAEDVNASEFYAGSDRQGMQPSLQEILSTPRKTKIDRMNLLSHAEASYLLKQWKLQSWLD